MFPSNMKLSCHTATHSDTPFRAGCHTATHRSGREVTPYTPFHTGYHIATHRDTTLRTGCHTATHRSARDITLRHTALGGMSHCDTPFRTGCHTATHRSVRDVTLRHTDPYLLSYRDILAAVKVIIHRGVTPDRMMVCAVRHKRNIRQNHGRASSGCNRCAFLQPMRQSR
jgi:hypothetical protein